MNPWLAAARPKTLIAGIVPVAMGSALSYQMGKFQPLVFLSALLGALTIQIGSNYVNDGADFEKGADTEERLGPPRMAAMGFLTPKALYSGAAISFLIAFLAGLYLVYTAGLGILLIGILSIFFAVIYTAGPFPLAYLGLGDFFVLIFFGLVAVLGTVYSHAQSINLDAVYLGFCTGIHGMSLIAVNNLRDIPTDEKIGKKTLSVRMGDRGSRIYFSILQVFPYFFWIPLSKMIPWGFLPFLAIPSGIMNIIKVFKIQDRKEFNFLLAKVAAHQLIFGALVVIAMVIG
jgi:1,4-dihydroxy-2-naphthoate octaprenyltransferase